MNENETEEEKLEVLRDTIVGFLLQIKSQYLANGANPIKYLGQLQSRMKFAANTTSTVEEWSSEMCRKLQLSPSSALSFAMIELREMVHDEWSDMEFIELIDRETPMLLAMMQVEAQRIRDERKNRQWNASNTTSS